MKIADVSAIVLRLPEVTDACDGTQDTCLIRIDTDEGIVGWGEVDSCPTVVKAVVEAPLSHQICNGIANALRGQDPLALEACTQRMDEATNYYGRVGAGSHAAAGVNLALWDIAGKAYDQPVHRLLGGPVETSFRAYCSILFGDTPAETYDLGRRFADQGFTAVKFGWGPMGQDETQDVELIRQARRGVGDEVDVLIDAGQVWDWKTALKRAHQFSEFRPFWLEEPLHPQDVAGYANLAAESPLPIATGEDHHGRYAFRQLVEHRCVDVLQPDINWCGGLTEAVKIYIIGEAAGLTTIPHGGANSPFGQHFSFAMPESPMAEYWLGTDPGIPLEEGKPWPGMAMPENGYVIPSDEPGFGLGINEDWIRTT